MKRKTHRLDQKFSRLGCRFLGEKKASKALVYFRQAQKYNPSDPAIYGQLINAHKKISRHWSESDFADTLTWEMLRQALRHQDVSNVHAQLLEQGAQHTIKKIGLTGGIATGKSRVLALFEKRGISVISADHIVHELTGTDGAATQLITNAFGKKILNSDGTLNRHKLAEEVFSSTVKRRQLEAILHPLIMEKIGEKVTALQEKGEPLVMIEIPLLFETGLEDMVKSVILVTAPHREQVRRLKKRGWKRSHIQARIKSQWPMATKKERADFIIDNSGSIASLEGQVHQLLPMLKLL